MHLDCDRPRWSFPGRSSRFRFRRPSRQARRECFRPVLLVLVVSYFSYLVLGSRHEIAEKSVRMLRSLLVLCDQHCENRSQQHENERLHKSHEHFEEIEGNWQDWRQQWDHRGHRFENAFAGINISKQSKTERDRSKHDRDHFEPANGEKDDDHEDLHDTGRLTFWAKQMFQESADTVGLNRPDKPHHEEYG